MGTILQPNTLSSQLLYSTVRISVNYRDGTSGIGTGFFYRVIYEGEDKSIPLIVTNKHVIENSETGTLTIRVASRNNGEIVPTDKSYELVIGQFSKRFIYHPDDDIDLCAMAFQPIIGQCEALHKFTPYIMSISKDVIFSDEQLLELNPVEEILMIGYPIGLYDQENNYPIIRRGITASHPVIPFNNKKYFVIDAACFPGSSGSPVFLVNEGIYVSKKGTVVGSRGAFLGVLFAGPQFDTEGEIVIRNIPTRHVRIAISRIMIHLGYVIQANEVKTLGQFVKTLNVGPPFFAPERPLS